MNSLLSNITSPEFWSQSASSIQDLIIGWLTSPAFYAQLGGIAVAVFLAWFAARTLTTRVPWFTESPEGSKTDGRLLRLRTYAYACRDLLFPALTYVLLGLAADLVSQNFGTDWLVRIARSISVIILLYHAINRFITHPVVKQGLLYLGIPVATLQAFGWLDATIAFLEGISFQAGNINLSLYFLIKTAITAGFFFWLGSTSSRSGQSIIRSQETLDIGTRELFAKLFQIGLFSIIFILMLQVLGLDLTALAIFGGALGVGLGFGLQQIASNFISGIILLIERTLTVGDYIELEDGRMGTMKELNMRSATLETFDGKEIMVPNEKFITGVFVNWTRDDPRQRYEVEFSVSYDTDIMKVPELITDAVKKHPKVLTDPEEPDCELRGFGDSGINFGLEFWIEGIDDGKNRISSDLLFIIWETLKENGITIPFPQREVRILDNENSNPNNLMSIKKTAAT
ncbi:MAG: mechanosensitive ion channel domain-containing protein [Pseudomonadota bacterium]